MSSIIIAAQVLPRRFVQRYGFVFLVLPCWLIGIGAMAALAKPGSQQGQGLEWVGQIGGRMSPFAIRERYLYAGVGDRFTVLDISNPVSPTVTSQLPPFRGYGILDVAVSEGYAFALASANGLYVVDIRNPAAIKTVGFLAIESWDAHLAVAAPYLYIADNSYGLSIIDVSDPKNPRRVGQAGVNGVGIATAGNHLYIAGPIGASRNASGLQIVDVSQPSAPIVIRSLVITGTAQDVVISGSHAYVASGDAGLRVIDLNDVARPTEVGSYTAARGSVVGAAVAGKYAYLIADPLPNPWEVNGYGGGLRVVDVSDLTTISLVGSYEPPTRLEPSELPTRVAIAGDYAFVASMDIGLRILRVANPAVPTEAGAYAPVVATSDVALSGKYAFVTGRGYPEGMVRVVDVSNPARPEEASTFVAPTATQVVVSGRFAYVWDGERGIRILDISDPGRPLDRGSVRLASYSSYFVSGSYLYAPQGKAGLLVFDVSRPETPTRVAVLTALDSTSGIWVSDNRAYVTELGAGLRILDVTNPADPRQVGFLKLECCVWNVVVSGAKAYLQARAPADASVHVIDISNPAQPVQLGRFPTSTLANRIAVSGDYVYVPDSTQGIRVVEVSNPPLPREVFSYGKGQSFERVQVSCGFVFLAGHGLVILRAPDAPVSPKPASTTSPTPPAPPRALAHSLHLPVYLAGACSH